MKMQGFRIIPCIFLFFVRLGFYSFQFFYIYKGLAAFCFFIFLKGF